METVLALFFLAIFIYLSWRKPIYGASIIVAFLPIYLWRFSLLGLPTSFLELMVLSLFIIWLVKDKKYRRLNFFASKQTVNNLSLVWRYLLVAWLLISVVALALNPQWSSLGLWRAYFLEPMMFFLVLIYELREERDFKFIWRAFSGLLIWLLILTIYQFFSSWNLVAAYDWPNVRRLTGVFSYPNALALLVAAPGTFFLAWAVVLKNKYQRLFSLALFLSSLLLVYWARSDGAILAIILTILFYLILAKKIRKFTWGALLLAIFLLANNSLFSNQLKIWQQELFAPQLDLAASSLEIRSSQWTETGRFLQDNFWLGAGLNGYQGAMKDYHQTEWLEIYLYPHNIFLNFWTELSLFGLLLFLLILIKIGQTLYLLHRSAHLWAWPLTMFWLTWILQGLVDVPYFKNDLSLLFFIFLALTISQENKSQ